MKKILISVLLLGQYFLFADKNMPAVKVESFLVNNNIVKINKIYPGAIVAKSKVEIIARVPGKLEKRFFKEGDYIQKGEPLYLIEQSTYKANLDSANAALEQAKALMSKASRDWKRYKKLYSKKAVSATTRDQYLYNYESASANVKSCEAALKNADIQYGYTRINAPISGIVSITKYNVGNFINANTTLTTITQIDPIYVEFSLSQKDVPLYLSQIRNNEVDLAVDCSVACLTGGKIDYISPVLDPGTDTLLIRALFPNEEAKLIIGQFTTISINNITIPKVITIPEKAIVQMGNNTNVYVIDDNFIAKIRTIKIGNLTSKGIIVESGLKEGEKIIISNLAKIRPGVKVEIIEGNK